MPIAKTEVICVCGCNKKFMARNADINRGWGKYYSKSCKAKAQEKRLRKFTDKLMLRRMEAYVLDLDFDDYVGFGASEDF